VLVTGATGIVGSWLVKELLSRSAHVVALIADTDPQTELVRSGDLNRVAVVNGRGVVVLAGSGSLLITRAQVKGRIEQWGDEIVRDLRLKRGDMLG
jgi:uncharacterized protein YbjT (DUF2867 family)